MVIMLTVYFLIFLPMATSKMGRVLFSCNFDENLCDFESVYTRNIEWTRRGDENGAGYAYVHSTDELVTGAGSAAIATPLLEAKRFRLSFNYAVYGVNVIYLQTDFRYNGGVSLLHWAYVQGNNAWNTFVGEYNVTNEFSVRFTAAKSNENDFLIAIDNVTVIELLDISTETGVTTAATTDEDVNFTTFVSSTSSSASFSHTGTNVINISSTKVPERTALEHGQAQDSMSGHALSLVWIFLGIVITIILFVLFIGILSHSRASRKRKQKTKVVTSVFQSGIHQYENCGYNFKKKDKNPNWKKYFQSSDVVHTNNTEQLNATNFEKENRFNITPLSQELVSLSWTQNPNYGHSLRNDSHYQVLPHEDDDDNLRTQNIAQNNVDYFEIEPEYHVLPADEGNEPLDPAVTNRESGKPHVYAIVSKRPSKTVWEENPIYQTGDKL